MKNNRICERCIGEEFLRSEVEKIGVDAKCSYCHANGKSISIGKLADYVSQAFADHFEVTPTEPSGFEYMMLKESNHDWERAGDQAAYAIQDAAHIDIKPAEHVREVLNDQHSDFDTAAAGDEQPFAEGSHYSEKSIDCNELQAAWSHFERSLKTEARLFNRTAQEILDSIFTDLDQHATHTGKSVIVNVGPGRRIAALYRARVFQSDSKLEHAIKRPDIELAPPPPAAAVAGRMNALGIAVFYGSIEAGVALAEVRPPVGSRVLVGRFDIIRPLHLLDVEALRSIYVGGSVFDSTYIRRLEKAMFLKSLSHRITIPVMPDDEPSEYLVTQAIADYLATCKTPAIDGIIYPSVQNGKTKRNAVLLHKASRVELLDIPEGSEISATLYDADEERRTAYRVFEDVPPPKKQMNEASWPLLIQQMQRFPDPNSDVRESALRLDIASLHVCEVSRVKVHATSFEVTRYRGELRTVPTISKRIADLEDGGNPF